MSPWKPGKSWKNWNSKSRPGKLTSVLESPLKFTYFLEILFLNQIPTFSLFLTILATNPGINSCEEITKNTLALFLTLEIKLQEMATHLLICFVWCYIVFLVLRSLTFGPWKSWNFLWLKVYEPCYTKPCFHGF